MSDKNSSPAPPPPPFPPVAASNLNLVSHSKESSDLPKTEIEELDHAVERLLSADEKLSKIFYLTNTHLKPQLQVGPKCGLVALSIATSMLQNFVSVDDIFERALSKGFTRQGEIFSVNFLAELAEKCGFKTRIIEGGLDLHLNCIVRNLLNKGLLLVPYDSDHNHYPCCKQGFKAHWAIISGIAIFISCNKSTETGNNNTQDSDDDENIVSLEPPNCSVLCDCLDSKFNSNYDLVFFSHQGKLIISKNKSIKSHDDFRKGKIYLIGRQGKSKHIAFWSFNKVSESNNNLLFFSSNRNSEFYVLPHGGPAEGLKGKAIILLPPIK